MTSVLPIRHEKNYDLIVAEANLLVSDRRGQDKDDSTKSDKSENGEKSSSEVSCTGGDHLCVLCDVSNIHGLDGLNSWCGDCEVDTRGRDQS